MTQVSGRPKPPGDDDSVVFVTTEDEEQRTPLTVKDAPEPLKRVRVVAPFQVVFDTVPYRGGDTPTVPVALADQWIKNQWVEEASA